MPATSVKVLSPLFVAALIGGWIVGNMLYTRVVDPYGVRKVKALLHA